MNLSDVRPGDTVARFFEPDIETMRLKVSEVDHWFIHCGPWKFDRINGAEIDEDLEWDRFCTGSYIRSLPKTKQ